LLQPSALGPISFYSSYFKLVDEAKIRKNLEIPLIFQQKTALQKFFRKKLPKYLVVSKKLRTFAVDLKKSPAKMGFASAKFILHSARAIIATRF